MRLGYLFVILFVVGCFVLLIMYAPNEKISTAEDQARQLITQFTKSGEYIGFDLDPTPPVTKYRYEPVQKTKQITFENGTTVNQTETVYEKTEVKQTTTLSVDIQDRTLKQSKICKLGYQCDITGTIILIDPTTDKKIPPPYSYLATIDCDFRSFCNLGSALSSNEATFGDGSFKYTWIPTPAQGIGEYRLTVYVISHFTNQDTDENERRIAVRNIEVVN